MKIVTTAIIANSDIIKNYKACREKAEINGKVFIFKNNQPDAVLFSVSEYEKLSGIIEYLENFREDEILTLLGKITSSNTNEIKKFE
jgi:PHD/YefM family antitoxin component YafN of YafNO toxin-antitoxin module